jgi:hypothetical protein
VKHDGTALNRRGRRSPYWSRTVTVSKEQHVEFLSSSVTGTKRPHHKEKTDICTSGSEICSKSEISRFKNPKYHVEISFRVCDDLDGFPTCLSWFVTGPKYQHVEMPLTICRVGEGRFFFLPILWHSLTIMFHKIWNLTPKKRKKRGEFNPNKMVINTKMLHTHRQTDNSRF